jgi:hypothetical protein
MPGRPVPSSRTVPRCSDQLSHWNCVKILLVPGWKAVEVAYFSGDISDLHIF